MKIAYFGNRLGRHGFSPTGIDKLSVLLAEEHSVVTASHQRNQVLRLLDMMRVLHRNLDADFVIIDTYSTTAFYYAAVIGHMCRHFSIRYIPILHGGQLETRLERSAKMCARLFGGAYMNVAPSSFLQATFEKHGYPTRIIPNSLDFDQYFFKRRHVLQPRLLYVRSFDRTYNPYLAVRVLHKLLSEYPAATLCMVGPDKDGSRTEVEALAASLGVSEKIKYTGMLAPALWHELAGNYDIFINTTNVDNTPISVVEAMALGLPVVSTNVGGLPHLIENRKDGILVDPDNSDAFVREIRFLISNPHEAARIAWNARNKAETFSSENVYQQWKEVLQDEHSEYSRELHSSL